MAREDGKPVGGPAADRSERLDSWKEIASYLGRGVTTVQRWEQENGLPVHRLPHAKKGSVFAYRAELDAWLAARARSAVRQPESRDEDGPAVAHAAPLRVMAASGTSRRLALRAGTALVVAIALYATYRATRPWSPSPAAGAEAVLRPARMLPPENRVRAPSLSPDGRQIAFAWYRGSEAGVYAKPLPDGVPRLLWDFDPRRNPVFTTRWSPDGELVAFNSLEGNDIYGLYVVPAAGGPATRLTTMAGVGICWAPDNRSLTFADRTDTSDPFSLFSIDLASQSRQRLTMPPPGSFGDTACGWSPDGRRLALVRYPTRHESDLFVLSPATGAQVERLTSGIGGVDNLEWAPDGQSVLFADHAGLKVVRPGDRPGPGRAVAGLTGDAGHVTFSRPRSGESATLAYQLLESAFGVWLWRRAEPGSTNLWLDDGRESNLPSLTRDGQRIAYVRGGEIWTADVANTWHRQLTSHTDAAAGRPVTDPEWSPDGRRVAFSVAVGDQRDIYVIDDSGANSQRLTSEPSDEDNPTWSSDGRSIYFRSNRSGRNHVWKVPAEGGAAVRVTDGEGWKARETTDGHMLYFVRGTSTPGLWARSLPRGEERLVLPEVVDGRWGLTSSGVVYVEGPETDSPRLKEWPFGARASRSLGPLPGFAFGGFAVSADGQTVLWTRALQRAPTIMLVDRWPNGP